MYIQLVPDMYLETWLWSPLTCAEKTLHVDIWDYMKIYTFNIFLFLTLSFLNYYYHITVFSSSHLIIVIIIILIT